MDIHSIPYKQKMLCVWKPFLKQKGPRRELTIDEEYASYEPDVLDLTKVEIKIEQLVRYPHN